MPHPLLVVVNPGGVRSASLERETEALVADQLVDRETMVQPDGIDIFGTTPLPSSTYLAKVLAKRMPRNLVSPRIIWIQYPQATLFAPALNALILLSPPFFETVKVAACQTRIALRVSCPKMISSENSPAPRHRTLESWCLRVISAVRAL